MATSKQGHLRGRELRSDDEDDMHARTQPESAPRTGRTQVREHRPDRRVRRSDAPLITLPCIFQHKDSGRPCNRNCKDINELRAHIRRDHSSRRLTAQQLLDLHSVYCPDCDQLCATSMNMAQHRGACPVRRAEVQRDRTHNRSSTKQTRATSTTPAQPEVMPASTPLHTPVTPSIFFQRPRGASASPPRSSQHHRADPPAQVTTQNAMRAPQLRIRRGLSEGSPDELMLSASPTHH